MNLGICSHSIVHVVFVIFQGFAHDLVGKVCDKAIETAQIGAQDRRACLYRTHTCQTLDAKSVPLVCFFRDILRRRATLLCSTWKCLTHPSWCLCLSVHTNKSCSWTRTCRRHVPVKVTQSLLGPVEHDWMVRLRVTVLHLRDHKTTAVRCTDKRSPTQIFAHPSQLSCITF